MNPPSQDARLSTGQQKISGYRDLTPKELDLVNEIKQLGNHQLHQTLAKVEALAGDIHPSEAVELIRWRSIAKTHFQQGTMALIRAVTRPGGF